MVQVPRPFWYPVVCCFPLNVWLRGNVGGRGMGGVMSLQHFLYSNCNLYNKLLLKIIALNIFVFYLHNCYYFFSEVKN